MFHCRRLVSIYVTRYPRFIGVFFLTTLVCCTLLGCQPERDNSTRNILNEARRAYVDGSFYHAETLLEQYLDKSGDPIGRKEAWNRLFDIVVTVRGDGTRGLRILKAMALEFNEDPILLAETRYRSGELHDRMGETDKAILDWQKYLDLAKKDTPERGKVMLRLARLCTELERYDDAQMWLSRCVKTISDPEEISICKLEQGHTAFLMGKDEEAITFFTSLSHDLKANHQLRPIAIFALAQVYERMRKRRKAAELYSSILTTHPNPQAVRLRLDYLHSKKNTSPEQKTPK